VASGYASAVKKGYMLRGQAQKRRFIVTDAGERWVCAQRHMWKISAMSVSKLGMPSIGVGPSGKAPYMSARDVGVAEDMVSRIIGEF
jgi:hypothetical protein